MILPFLLTVIIVGFVTAGLNIRFDRFFTILLLLFLFKFTIFKAINIFLWVIMFGALMILLNNKDKIISLPNKMKVKLLVMIPLFTFIASFLGTLLFAISKAAVLIIILGVLAVLYGLRLIIVHFEEHELNFEKGHPLVTKICGFLGPWISGFSIGVVGTSLKPLKIPFAIKIGKMNAKQVYVGNSMTAFFASLFSIIWHFFFTSGMTLNLFYDQMLLALALFAGIHFMFEITNLFFPERWRKGFQILIGMILVLVSLKIFMLAV